MKPRHLQVGTQLLRAGMTSRSGFVPTFEVQNLDKFIQTMKKKGVKLGRRIAGGDHARLVDFFNPNDNLLQAFKWKRKR